MPPPERELGAGGGSNTAQTARILAAWSRCSPSCRPISSSSTATPTARSPGRSRQPKPPCRWGTWRPACAPSIVRCRRSSTACSPTTRASCCSAPRRPRCGIWSAIGRWGGHLVGDVMADVSMAFREIARERSTVLADLGLEPGGYLAVTAHRAGNVDRRERLERLVELLTALPGPVVFPVHPRTPRTARSGGPARPAGGAATDAAARLPRLPRARRNARAVLTDSEGVQKDLPDGRAGDHPAGYHRVGRDRRLRLERARGPRRRGALAALEGRPTDRPELYGGGHAAERGRVLPASYTAPPT